MFIYLFIYLVLSSYKLTRLSNRPATLIVTECVLSSYKLTRLSNNQAINTGKSMVLSSYKLTRLSNERTVVCNRLKVLSSYKLTRLSNLKFKVLTEPIYVGTYRKLFFQRDQTTILINNTSLFIIIDSTVYIFD